MAFILSCIFKPIRETKTHCESNEPAEESQDMSHFLLWFQLFNLKILPCGFYTVASLILDNSVLNQGKIFAWTVSDINVICPVNKHAKNSFQFSSVLRSKQQIGRGGGWGKIFRMLLSFEGCYFFIFIPRSSMALNEGMLSKQVTERILSDKCVQDN